MDTIGVISNDESQYLIKLRQILHRHPELSGNEKGTASRIKSFINEVFPPTRFIESIGGYGLAAVYEFNGKGPVVVIRCELDALPIQEDNDLNYSSKSKGVSHKCGHDGHMAMVAGLAFWLRKQKFTTGKVILLFQPAEETGQGAKWVMSSPFKELSPDYVFALHNMPGLNEKTILIAEETFSCAVESIAITLSGKESHAADPQSGNNPALAIAAIVSQLASLQSTDIESENYVLLTPVCIKMGQEAYGISPGEGEVHYTIRAKTDERLEMIKDQVMALLEQICESDLLQYTVEWKEYFPASVNDLYCNNIIETVALEKGLSLIKRKYPFSFGEDFGWYSRSFSSSMFALGAGINIPALHHKEYNFPDQIISTGLEIFTGIITRIFNE